MSKLSVELGAVQETLLIPLLGRAVATQKGSGLIEDPKAVEIVEALDYDFSKWQKSKALMGATVRTRMFDEDVQAFLAEHPTGTVVEIGCGLNTRFERLDNGQARWFDLDLPDSLALRRHFFQDQPRRTMLSGSVLETSWMNPVAATGGPWCFISEAVLIYLETAEAHSAIAQIADRFPGAWLLFDTTGQKMVESQATHELMRHLPQESWFRWVCDEPQELETLGNITLLRSRTLLDASPALLTQIPGLMGWLIRHLPWLFRKQISGYRLNQFVVPTQSS
ncbi:MAG: class I SAM-dependent methyltransferase [Cyanobacteria bacterium P01_H01_bin.15]